MKTAKTLTALALLHSANASSRSASERRWKSVRERYTRSMSDALSAAKRKIASDPGAAVKELRKFNQAYYSGPKTHKKGLTPSELSEYKIQHEQARRLAQQAKMARASRKLQVLNKQGRGKSTKAQTLRNRSSRGFGYKF
jgi:ribosomal protein L13E